MHLTKRMYRRFHWQAWVSLFTLLVYGLTACLGTNQPTTATPNPSLPTPLPEALITFRVQIPETLLPGESIYLSVLDEVTGLAINPQNFVMDAEDPQHYVVILPFMLNSMLKYRYIRQGTRNVQEHVSDGRAVRYRLFHVEGPGVVQDVVSRWTDTQYTGPSGRISGQVTDAQSSAPIPNILVTAGGAQTLTSADGQYLLEGLPPGTHNVVAYALDGSYQVYQQGAVVAEESTTPAPLLLTPAPRVNVVFILSVPAGTYPVIPIRLAGNLYQLGNTYADLSGGVNTIASRMPVMMPLADGRYSLTLNLPVGADIRYKYTLGDGLWNSEHNTDGSFRVRQLIVPETSTQVNDQVITWQAGKSAPITFDTAVPAHTPWGDNVSIQFSPGYGWTEAIPMWPVGNNRWIYVLFSPLDNMGSASYRFCRNDLCGSADDARTMGPFATGSPIKTSQTPEMIVDPVNEWAWLQPLVEPITLPNNAIQPRASNFMAGVEFQPTYHPTWKSHMPAAISDVRNLNANWIVITPSWTFTRLNLPVLEPLPSQDALWPDVIENIQTVRSQSMSVAVFPSLNFPGGENLWWQQATKDFAWWVVWFERYRTFMLHHADLAAHEGAGALIIGGEWIAPALPGGSLSDGTPSSVPQDAEARWSALLAEIRSRFTGALIWAMPYPEGVENPPPFLAAVDEVYLLWSARLSNKPGVPEGKLANEAGRLLDETVKPLQLVSGKPYILGLSYPSAQGGITGCLPAPEGIATSGDTTSNNCLDLDLLSRPNPDIPSITLDLDEQVRAYNAMMIAVNERDWISGVVARGFYPPAILQDKSSSVHGKPALGVLWHWFQGFLASGQ